MAVHVDIEDLVHKNQADHKDEVDRVNFLVTAFHEESGDEQAEGEQVHSYAENFVQKNELAAASILQLLVGEHGIDNDAESKEEGVLGEEQNHKDAVDASAGELIDQQVNDDQELADKKRFRFSKAGLEPVVVPDANDHVNGHHGGLKHDPALLDSVGDRGVVILVVEVVRMDPVVRCVSFCHVCPMFRLFQDVVGSATLRALSF